MPSPPASGSRCSRARSSRPTRPPTTCRGCSFLQGGPGFEAPRPVDRDPARGSTARCRTTGVLLLDQRGMGRSTPIGARRRATARRRGSWPTASPHHRADAIVRDAEAFREALGVEHVVAARAELRRLLRRRLPLGVPRSAERGVHHRRAAAARPRHRRGLRRDLPHAHRQEPRATTSATPRTATASPSCVDAARRRRTCGCPAATAHPAPAPRARASPGHGAGRRAPAPHPRAAVAQPGVPARRRGVVAVRPQPALRRDPRVLLRTAASRRAGRRSALRPAAYDDDPTLLTGEHIYPWMFDEMAALVPFRDAAHLLADRAWGPLYDPEVLAANEVPVAAAVYADDMYVPRVFSEETAGRDPRPAHVAHQRVRARRPDAPARARPAASRWRAGWPEASGPRVVGGAGHRDARRSGVRRALHPAPTEPDPQHLRQHDEREPEHEVLHRRERDAAVAEERRRAVGRAWRSR